MPFPRTFVTSLRQMYSRMFRVYAIIYASYFQNIVSVGAVPHLNTSFKHFMFFVWEFDLVNDQEFRAVPDLVSELREKYDTP